MLETIFISIATFGELLVKYWFLIPFIIVGLFFIIFYIVMFIISVFFMAIGAQVDFETKSASKVIDLLSFIVSF